MAKRRGGKKRPTSVRGMNLPADVAAIRKALRIGLDQVYAGDALNRKVGNAKFGVYAFFDYDGEPIYVGQTYEGLRARIGRHLTNQRTDAVAMHVLDPFEVMSVQLWPFFDLEDAVKSHPSKSQERKNELEKAKARLQKAEYAVYQLLLAASKFRAILNEKDIAGSPAHRVSLPTPVKFQIVPDEVHEVRKHPDVRIARRASTIAKLTQVISERDVSKGLRRTLLTQARRLEDLTSQRYEAVGGPIPVESGEEDE